MTDPPKRLYIPETLTKERFYECGVCGAGFSKHQTAAFDKHIYACAQSDEAHEMEQHSPRVKFPFFRPDFGDVEYEQWVKQHARAIVEGRTKM